MPSLLIRHTGEDPFRVERIGDGKQGPEAALKPPDQVQVEGRDNSHLLRDLAWYLEQFLDYPYPPNDELAERIQAALADWGRQCFERLFAGQPLLWYDQARQGGLAELTLKIASDDPRVLGWPWEALADPDGGTLAHACRIERQLSALHDPLPLPEGLPRDRIHILLVIARPYGEQDVGYHALARPLVEQVQTRGLPVRVDVLRPPTFEQLRRHLHAHPGRYHMVHFDGHGGYGEAGHTGSAHSFRGIEGRLIFEDAAAQPDPIPAAKLTALLGEHRIPIMVLNACQSARIDARADDPFASVAAALLKAGIRAVVAMGYNLYVSGAQRFVPAFYDRLLETGAVAEAVRAGRGAMLADERRVCARGTHPLADWLVPVLYQQDPLDLPVTALRPHETDAEHAAVALPDEARRLDELGFIGRQRAIQALERALQTQPQPAILVHGMAGIGKTTLARGLAQWLADTHGLGADEDGALFAGVLWLQFDALRGLEPVINEMVAPLLGHDATAAPLDDRLAALTRTLRERPLLIVWDNFESAAGIPGTEVTPQLADDERERLRRLLQDLRGGRSRVLITSRAPETWLGKTTAYALALPGLDGEERWEYCNALLAELGLRPDRDDTDFARLLDALDGHPLAMRAVLLRLDETPAATLRAELEAAFAGAEGDPATRRIFAALGLLDAGLPEAFAPLLPLIGLHRRFVDIGFLEVMAQAAGTPVPRGTLEHCLAALETGGLLHHQGQGIHRMHPALGGYLGERHPAAEPARRAFVDTMGLLADQLAPKQLHEQRGPFAVFGASFHQAMALAWTLGMDWQVGALTKSLAAYAQHRRDLATAGRLFQALAAHCEAQDRQDLLAVAYHQLGIIAQEQRNLDAAEAWYRKSLAINEKQGNEHGAAISYHNLGVIAEELRDFAAAEAWYRKSLAIFEKKANEHGAASSYHQLGMIAQEQRDFAAAEAWYRKSLAIEEKQGNEHGAANSYHQLGRIAEEQRDLATAEAWYRKALAIDEKQGNEHGAAISYHNLGIIAQEQRDLDAAEAWYRKSLAIEERQGNEHGAALSYGQLGMLAEEQRDLETAGAWALKAIGGFARANDPHHRQMAVRDFFGTLQSADPQTQTTLRQAWHQAGLDQTIAPLADLERQFAEQPHDD